jgi:hypothetical protein
VISQGNARLRVPIVFATDEDVCRAAPQDYVALCPRDQVRAYGADGVFTAGSWSLTSASVVFDATGCGVAPNSVIVLTKPAASFRAQWGALYAVDSVAGGTAVLRNYGGYLAEGQPPSPAGVTAVEFTVRTFAQQIEDVCYDLYKSWGIDPLIGLDSPGLLYDARELCRLCVVQVLVRAYTDAVKSDTGDYDRKLRRFQAELDELRSRVEVHWGNLGAAELGRHKFVVKVVR